MGLITAVYRSYILSCIFAHIYFPLICYVCISPQDMLRLEAEVKSLHAAVDQIQATLASPELNKLSLREQLTQRQVNTNIILANSLCPVSLQMSFKLASIDIHLAFLSPVLLSTSLLFNKRLLVEMEGFKQQVAAVQQCQSALRLPEEVVASLPICRTAQTLQQEASQVQHTTIQQCNILQVKGSPSIMKAVDELLDIKS